MAAPGLPVNIDGTYGDDAGDASVKVHQQHHDEVHKVVNLFDDATPATAGMVHVWDGAIGTARILTEADVRPKIEQVSITGAKTADITTTTAKMYTLTGNVTFTFAGAPTGGDNGRAGVFTLVVKQDATGGRTVTWPGIITWLNGPTPATAANAATVFEFLTTDGGTSWFGFQPGLAAGGGSSTEQQGSLVLVRPKLGATSTFQAFCREHGNISENTNATTVIQAAIDHASNFAGSTGHTGGEVRIAANRYLLTSPIVGRAVTTGGTVTVWPITVSGEGAMENAPVSSGVYGGTVLQWNSGSAPSGSGAVLDMGGDCHGYRVRDIAIDGNGTATYCAKSAGRGIEWHSCQFRDFVATTSGRGLWITNGADTASDRYVQQRILFCRAENAGDGGIGFYIANSGAGSGCTDGRVRDVQTNGCNDGGLYLGEGGWGVSGGHITHNNTAGGRLWGIQVNAGFIHITNVYVDIVGLGPSIDINNSNVTITNCFLIANGKVTNNTYDLIDAAGQSSVTIVGNTWGGTGNTARYFFNGTSAGQAVIGNVGPSASIGTSVLNPGFAGYSAGNLAS